MRRCDYCPQLVHPPLRQRPPVLGLMPCRRLQQKDVPPWRRFARSEPVKGRSGGKAGGACRGRMAACRTARRTSRAASRQRPTPRRCARSNAAASATRTDMISPATCAHGWRTTASAATSRRPRCGATNATPPWRRDTCGHVLLEKLSGRDLDALYAKLLTHGGQPKGPPRPLSRQSVMHVHRLLHGALRQAVKWRLLAHNPAADATPPSVPHKQARGFTTEEIARLLAAAEGDAELHCILALLLVSGLRRSELLGLTLEAEALDLEAGTLSVARTVTEIGSKVIVREITKTKLSRRTLSVPAAVVLLLRAQKARVLEQALAWGSEYAPGPRFLFPVNGGAPMRPFSLTERLARLMRRAGIKGVQPIHGWRHAMRDVDDCRRCRREDHAEQARPLLAPDHAGAVRR